MKAPSVNVAKFATPISILLARLWNLEHSKRIYEVLC